MTNIYELSPMDNRKSFYGKAIVHINDDGCRQLYSYGTLIMTIKPDGTAVRNWDGWSLTTGRHIKAFCDMNKAAFMALPME